MIEKNLECFKKLYGEVTLNKILETKKPDFIKETSNGDNFILSKKGEAIPGYDPEKPKENIKETLKEYSFEDGDCTILIGAGAGHSTEYIKEKMSKKHKLVIIEPVLYFLKTLFERFDLSEEIAEKRILFPECNKESLTALLAIMETHFIIQSFQVIREKYTFHMLEEYQETSDYVSDLINQIQCNVGTVAAAGYKIAKNDIENLPYILPHRGVDCLKDLYKDKPAVIIATGPSMMKNIHWLLKEDNREKVIIISVVQALRGLLALGLKPDFICTVDYCEVNIEHFKMLWDCNVPLVALNRTYYPILQQWMGPLFISVSSSPPSDESVVGYIQKKGTLEQGGSVSHFNLGLAIHLGCSPIMMLGQDLAFEKDLSHMPLVDAGGKVKEENGMLVWDIDDPRSILKDKTHGMGMTQYVEGYFGGYVSTNVGLASFKTSFEMINHAYKDKVKILNCTEGGAKINGIRRMSFRSALETYAVEKIEKDVIIPYFSRDPDFEKDVERCIELLEKELSGLNIIYKESIKAIRSSDKLKKEKDKKKLEKLMNENYKHSIAAEKEARSSNLMGLYLYSKTRAIHSRKYNVKKDSTHLLNNKEDLNKRIESNQMILKAARDASADLIKSFEKVLADLKHIRRTKDLSKLYKIPDIEVDLSDSEKYFSVGNFAHPLLDAQRVLLDFKTKDDKMAKEVLEKAIKMREEFLEEAEKREDNTKLIEYLELIEEAQKEGRERKDFLKAKELLEKAEDLFPEKEEAKIGLATTYYFLKEFEKAEDKYKFLVERNPDNKRLKFEYAQVLLLIDIKRSFLLFNEVFQETDEFDSFLLKLSGLYFENDLIEESKIAVEKYLEKFPFSIDGWRLKKRILSSIGNQEEEILKCEERLHGIG